MNEEYAKQNKGYCPHCGTIGGIWEHGCVNCNYPRTFEINPKWNITEEIWEEMYAPVRYGEITEEEFDRKWDEYCRPFTEEVIMKHPDFSQEAYDKRMAARYPSEEELARRARIEEATRKFREKERRKNPHRVKCPTCHSTNTQKISGVERATSVGLFGLFSKKIGKTWKCNDCGYMW